MGRTIINLFELGELIRAGKKTTEIAEHFGVTPRAVQKKSRELELGITKNAALHQSGKVLQQDLDAREQLLKINQSANRLLDLLEEQVKQDQEGLVAGLHMQIVNLRMVLGEDGQERWEPILDQIEATVSSLIVSKPATIELLFKALAEIRQQIALLVKVAAEILEASRVNEIHRIMVEEIGVESPECQSRIIRRLQGSNLLLTAVGFA